MSEATNPWVVQAPKQTAQVPNGFYQAEFKGVEVVMLEDKPKWRWTWIVKGGAENGKQATALTDQAINPNTLPGQLIAGLLDRAIVTGENVKDAIDACKGKAFMISVSGGPKGGKPGVRTVGKPPSM